MGMGNGKVEGEERETKRVIEERNGKEKRKEDRERNSKRE